MADEQIYSINGNVATPAEPITMAQAGLYEREHLQEWVLSHPDIMAPSSPGDVVVISTEYDRWSAGRGTDPLDRLDVLGLDRNGRLVLAELKRDMAPDSVSSQALTYAALVSRFTEDDVVDEYIRTAERRTKQLVDRDHAVGLLRGHCQNQLTSETLARPRVVLIAGDFPARVKATAVWLTEMGLSIALIRVQAYRTAANEIVASASQIYPLPDMEDFTVRPRRSYESALSAGDAMPVLPWTAEDLVLLAPKVSSAVHFLLDNCSAHPGGLVTHADLVAGTSLTAGQVNGALGNLSRVTKRDFARRNWPYEWLLAAGGGSAYRMDQTQATAWLTARERLATTSEIGNDLVEGSGPAL